MTHGSEPAHPPEPVPAVDLLAKLQQSLQRGLADSHAGRVRDLGDFTQYADTAGDPAK